MNYLNGRLPLSPESSRRALSLSWAAIGYVLGTRESIATALEYFHLVPSSDTGLFLGAVGYLLGSLAYTYSWR